MQVTEQARRSGRGRRRGHAALVLCHREDARVEGTRENQIQFVVVLAPTNDSIFVLPRVIDRRVKTNDQKTPMDAFITRRLVIPDRRHASPRPRDARAHGERACGARALGAQNH